MIEKALVENLVMERFSEMGEGYYIVDIKISPMNQILIEIDHVEKPISIDDCIRVSRNVEHSMDREEQDFELQVMSPGLTEPFKVFQQYVKNIGRKAKVKMLPEGKIEGLIVEPDTKKVVMETKEKRKIEGKKKKEVVVEKHELPYEKIKETKLIISF